MTGKFIAAGGELQKFTGKLGDVGKISADAGRALTIGLTAPIALVGGGSLKAAIDFESAFAGVRKTVDATTPELDAMSLAFRKMATEMPASAVELSRVGEAAGALGVKKENIVEFTRTMAMLGATTNLSADEAATSLARFSSIAGVSTDDVGKLGSALVYLGNNGASTEREIMAMGLRIAAAGRDIGLTAGQTLGMANALSSLGLEAEAGGSAMSKTMTEMARAVAHGGEELEKFGKVALPNSTQAGADFAKMFKDDAGAAVTAFMTGLGHVQEHGTSLIDTLDGLGITELRQVDAMKRAAAGGDLFAESMRNGTEAVKNTDAINKEYNERMKTTASQLALLWNQVNDVAISLGGALLPALRDGVSAAKDFIPYIQKAVEWFTQLPTPVKDAAIGFGLFAAAVGPFAMLAGGSIKALTDIYGAVKLLSDTAMFARIASGFGTATQVVTGIGTAAAGSTVLVNALGAALVGLGIGGLIVVANKLKEMADTRVGEMMAADVKKASGSFTDLAGNVKYTTDYVKKLGTEFEGPTQQLTFMGKAMNVTGEAAKKLTGDTEGTTKAAGSLRSQLAELDAKLKSAGASTRADLAEGLKSGVFSMKELAEKTGLSEEAIKRFEQKMKDADKATKDAQEKLDKAKDVLGKIAAIEARGLITELPDNLSKIGRSYDDSKLAEMVDKLREAENSVRIANFGLRGFSDELVNLGEKIKPTIEDLEKIYGVWQGPLLPPKINEQRNGEDTEAQRNQKLRATAGLLRDVSGVLGKVNSQWAQLGATALEVASTLMEAFATGGWIGVAVAGIGMIADAMHSAEEQVNPVREKFVQLHGGLGKLNEQAHRVGLTLDRMLNARTPERYADAIKQLEDAFEANEQAIEDAKAAILGLGDSFNSIVSASEPAFQGFSKIKQAIDEATDAGGRNDIAMRQQSNSAAVYGQRMADLGVIALGTYGAMLAAGFSEQEALTKMHDGLQLLRTAYSDLGIVVDNVALKALLVADTINTNNPGLVAGVAALSDQFLVLNKYNLLNIDTLNALTRTGTAMYSDLQAAVAAAGGTTRDALMPMQKYLHEAQEAAESLNVPLDETTQMLIDQSKELGIWKEKGKDANALLLDGLQKLVDVMDKLVKTFERVPSQVTTEVRTRYTSEGEPTGDYAVPRGQGGDEAIYASRGARILADGVEYLSGGGHSGRIVGSLAKGTDTVHAMLTPGELVLNAAQQNNVGGAIAGNAAILSSIDRRLQKQEVYLPQALARAVQQGIQKAS